MTSDKQTPVIYMVHAHFPSHPAAEKGLSAIREAASQHELKMMDAALLLHDEDGKTHDFHYASGTGLVKWTTTGKGGTAVLRLRRFVPGA